MNKSIMMGRLVRDPDVRYSERDGEELAIANFRITVDRKYKTKSKGKKKGDSSDADFFNCVSFGRLAEFAEEYLVQGLKILVTGRMENDNYTNRDGDKVYGVKLIAEEIDFAESKRAFEERMDRDDEGSEDDEYEDRRSGKDAESRRSSRDTGKGASKGARGERPSGRQSTGSRQSGQNRKPTRRNADVDEAFERREEQSYEEFD